MPDYEALSSATVEKGLEFDRYHSQGRIVSHVPPDQFVLDVGCNRGHIARALVKKGCTVVGIEIDPEVAEEARKVCKEVFLTDVETLAGFPYTKKAFDVILFGDVLEHTVNPWKVLEGLKHYLKDDGRIVVSLPNIANWAIRLRLLFGIFTYEHTGILFDQHLRFFTLKTACELLKGAGFTIERVDATPGLHVSRIYDILLGRVLSKLPGYGFVVYQLCRTFKRLLCQQFIFIARPNTGKAP